MVKYQNVQYNVPKKQDVWRSVCEGYVFSRLYKSKSRQ